MGREDGCSFSTREMSIDRGVPLEISVLVMTLVLRHDRLGRPILSHQVKLSPARPLKRCPGIDIDSD